MEDHNFLLRMMDTLTKLTLTRIIILTQVPPSTSRPQKMLEPLLEPPALPPAKRGSSRVVCLIGKRWEIGGFGSARTGFVCYPYFFCEFFFSLTVDTLPGYYVIFTLILVITALGSIYHTQIVNDLTPVTRFLKR
jgi:hypothetical protein